METKSIRQGDVLLMPVNEKIPADAKITSRVVLAEGEITGHAHVLEAERVITWEDFVVVDGDTPGALKHEDHDPNPVYVVEPGQVYRVIRQRQFNLSEQWEQVQD